MARPFARCGGLRSGPQSQPIDPETFGTKAPEHLGTANIQPFRQFPPRLPFSFLPLGFLQKCAPVATLATLMRTMHRMLFDALSTHAADDLEDRVLPHQTFERSVCPSLSFPKISSGRDSRREAESSHPLTTGDCTMAAPASIQTVRTAPEEPWHRSNPNLDNPP